MTSHRSIPSGIIAFAIFAVAAGADASTVSNQRIEEVAPHITDVLLCKVTDANHFHEHMKLKDGNEGPAISVVAEYKVEVTEVLAGSWKRTDAPVVVRWSLRYPIVYDGNGVVTMTFSYIVPWSGIEVGLKKDQQYILCFHPIRAEDKILTLVRAEPVERKQAVIDALAWVKAWASLKKHLGDGTARITLMAFDKAGGRLAVLVRDEPDQRLFSVRQMLCRVFFLRFFRRHGRLMGNWRPAMVTGERHLGNPGLVDLRR